MVWADQLGHPSMGGWANEQSKRIHIPCGRPPPPIERSRDQNPMLYEPASASSVVGNVKQWALIVVIGSKPGGTFRARKRRRPCPPAAHARQSWDRDQP